jgi:hypothetical protein
MVGLNKKYKIIRPEMQALISFFNAKICIRYLILDGLEIGPP